MVKRLRALAGCGASLDRSVYLVTVGAVVLTAGACWPWSRVPSAAQSYVNAAGELVLRTEPHWTEIVARLTAFLGGLLCLGLVLRRRPPHRGALRGAWIGLAFLVAFPCWVNQWAADQVRDKKLLFREMNRVVDDMEKNMFEQQADWRDWQAFAPETVAAVTATKPEEHTWDAALFSPSRWDRALEEVLGVSHEFLGFFQPLLLAALLVGASCTLLGVHLASRLGFAGFRAGLSWGLGAAAVFLAAALVPRVTGEYLLIEAEQALNRGEQQEGLGCFRAAARWKPALRSSWWYYRRLGQLVRLRDRETSPEPFVAAAYTALLAGRAEAALKPLGRARDLAPQDSSARLFLGWALSEAGISAFDRGQYGLAREYWLESRAYVPINPTPWYGLALVYLRLKQFDRAARCNEQIVRLQGYLGYKRLTAASQALVARSWAALQRGDLPAAHRMHSRSLTPENW
jgi:tetratricopeptide (TPR) repeat protein